MREGVFGTGGGRDTRGVESHFVAGDRERRTLNIVIHCSYRILEKLNY
jgi:hypothetical protein